MPTRPSRKGNLALATNQLNGTAVRVIRGPKALRSQDVAVGGYRYDGLYRVDDHWHNRGKSGHLIWRFRLLRLDDQPVAPAPPAILPPPLGVVTPGRRSSMVQRVIRSTEVVNFVKQLHDYRCQCCGIRLETQAGPYAEGAHIRPLGAPHNGPDVPENVLCLCPNHHVLFDAGAILIEDDLTLTTLRGELRVVPEHSVAVAHIRYHREHYSATS